jgi:glycosyltransferase involved in cell wall biosynthesis
MNLKENTIPLISFVVVTHNRKLELVHQRIIKSIAKQDHQRKELILIGESCEKFKEVVESIKCNYTFESFKWTNIWRPEGKKEMYTQALQARARNRGISLSQGEYISCQDDDNELEPDFTSSLLDCIIRNNAEAAWCYCRAVMPDGSPFRGDFFPWVGKNPDPLRRRILYRIWKNAGIINPGSDIVKDQLTAFYNTEIFSTVDANEWLVKADVFRQFPFREKYSCADIEHEMYLDQLWNIDIRRAAVKAVCNEKPSLIYHLGGLSNTLPEDI